MTILTTTSLESNKRVKINFDGGDLSSDAGLLLIKEFAARVGLISLVKKTFKTNDTASFRFHVDTDNLMQIIYQIIAAYFEDDCADELTNEPVFTEILQKEVLHHSRHCPGSGTGWMKIPFTSSISSIRL